MEMINIHEGEQPPLSVIQSLILSTSFNELLGVLNFLNFYFWGKNKANHCKRRIFMKVTDLLVLSKIIAWKNLNSLSEKY